MTTMETRTLHFDLSSFPQDAEYTLLADGKEHKVSSYKKYPEKLAEHRKQNRALALRVLAARVAELTRQTAQGARDADRRRQVGSGMRGDKRRTIRTQDDQVTDHVDHFDSTGIVLKSGGHLDADIVVTATGLQLQALGGVTLSVDGGEIKPQDRFVYKAHMLEDVPNLFWCVGYTNASWTMRADMTARATAKLLVHMKSHGYTHAYPHLDGEPMPEKPSWDIQAGYVQRSPHALPKSGTKRPWNVRQNYYADAIDYRFDRITEAMVFGRVDQKTALAG